MADEAEQAVEVKDLVEAALQKDEGDQAIEGKDLVEAALQKAREEELDPEARKCKRERWVGYQHVNFPWLSTAFLNEVLPNSWFVSKRAWEKEACVARRTLRLLTCLRFGLKLQQLAAGKNGGA
ncbi:unnamed protein product [Symbiodinium sp. CCMP2592]|nr:unnamed protein product [Symbiodinium sp. CCMP2592]